jgi:hypothetical protein
LTRVRLAGRCSLTCPASSRSSYSVVHDLVHVGRLAEIRIKCSPGPGRARTAQTDKTHGKEVSPMEAKTASSTLLKVGSRP